MEKKIWYTLNYTQYSIKIKVHNTHMLPLEKNVLSIMLLLIYYKQYNNYNIKSIGKISHGKINDKIIFWCQNTVFIYIPYTYMLM